MDNFALNFAWVLLFIGTAFGILFWAYLICLPEKMSEEGRDPNRKPTDLNIYKCDECGFTRWVRTPDPFSFPRPYQGDWAVYDECCPKCGADFKGEAAK